MDTKRQLRKQGILIYERLGEICIRTRATSRVDKEGGSVEMLNRKFKAALKAASYIYPSLSQAWIDRYGTRRYDAWHPLVQLVYHTATTYDEQTGEYRVDLSKIDTDNPPEE